MEFLDLEGELSLLDNLIVELMPPADGGVFGTGELGERVKVEAIDNQSHEVEDVGPEETGDRRRDD